MKQIENLRRRYGIFACALLFACVLVGCSTTELEERSFPMLVAVEFENGKVTYKEAFPKEDKTGSLGAREKDYSHLKVLVFEEDLLEQQAAFENVLTEWAKDERFPRNTYVCAFDDADDLFEMEKNISQDLGTYLEEFLKQHEEKKDRLLTLGDLLDEQANQSMILYLPYMEVDDNVIKWKGYMNTSGKSWQESQVE